MQVFLSATLSNAREFSQWVAHLHKQPCHVVYTEFRPTPLQHYVVPMGGSTLYKVCVLSDGITTLFCAVARTRVDAGVVLRSVRAWRLPVVYFASSQSFCAAARTRGQHRNYLVQVEHEGCLFVLQDVQ